MKKVLAIVLASAMILSLAGCGAAASATPEQKEAVAEAVAEKAEEVKEAVEEKATEAPAAQAAVKEEVQASDEGAKDFKVAGIVFQDDQFMNMLTKVK